MCVMATFLVQTESRARTNRLHFSQTVRFSKFEMETERVRRCLHAEQGAYAPAPDRRKTNGDFFKVAHDWRFFEPRSFVAR